MVVENIWQWVVAITALLMVARVFIMAVKYFPQDFKITAFQWIDSVLVAIFLVFLIIRPFVVQAFYIPTGSMEPTLIGARSGGDRILVNKFIYKFKPIQRNDIIVFRAPPEALEDSQKRDYIKRVIGLPGDMVEVRANDGVYVNGKRLNEPYIADIPDYDAWINDGVIYRQEWETIYVNKEIVNEPLNKLKEPSKNVIPPGKLFVLGDNRNDSKDSHIWGLLDTERVLGRALCIFWPPQRIRIIH